MPQPSLGNLEGIAFFMIELRQTFFLYFSGYPLVFEDMLTNICVTSARLNKVELEKEFCESGRHISVAIKVLNKKTPLIYIFRELLTQTLVDHAHRNFP
jgi:hypothetical protein